MSSERGPQIWRLKLNPKGGETTHTGEIFDYCIAEGIVALGWGIHQSHGVPADFDTYRQCAEEITGRNAAFGGWPVVERLALEARAGDLCWLRSPANVYFLARIEGEWEYRDDPAARRVGLFNSRPARIHEIGNAAAVPGKVVTSFSGQGRALQRIPDETTSLVSRMLGNEYDKTSAYDISDDAARDFLNLLSPVELEELVLIRMQLDGYVIFAGSRKGNTLSYEWVAKRKDRPDETFVVQVKSGRATADQAELLKAGTPVIFDASTETLDGVIRITRDRLLDCVNNEFHLMPENLQRRATLCGMAPAGRA